MTAEGSPSVAPSPAPPGSAFPEWFDMPELERALADSQPSTSRCRAFIKEADRILSAKFLAGADIESLVYARSWLVDQVLSQCWNGVMGDFDGALVAVGGYGRNELLPGSDVDLMILLPVVEDADTGRRLENFLMLLWDIGLEVGHSVRTLEECSSQAAADITVATSLMEARLLTGSRALFETMRESVCPARIWPSKDFFEAKLREQEERYERFDDAMYNLEPNVKEGPGGLRDAQVIGWIFKRHFGTDRMKDMVSRGLITENEYHALMEGQRFLWKVRFGLHHLTRRREDRLLFDHQRTLAKQFGYRDSEHELGVERFMRDYYRAIRELSRLNEMLLQLFKEMILYAGDPGEVVPINRRFQARKGFLEVVHERSFKRYPFALLELFLLMQQNSKLKGVRASTIRLVRDHCYLIDDSFRADLRCRSLFMEIFRQPRGLTHELRRMNRYGILGAYYPTFGNIIGQMQHDLFHAYTVDEHTLFVIRNLRRFSISRYAHEFPLCSRIAETIPKRELLYLAGFFHDIGKGRGGDHAELGAVDALEFLRLHGLSEYDCNLVSWLVQNHLLMSQVAQRRDTTDPEVINEFARQVGSMVRLDYLYLLTVGDIRGTNPNLWNSWKDALLKDLYTTTRLALSRGLENPLLRGELINDIKEAARQGLIARGIDLEQLHRLWDDFPDYYFLRHKADEIIWHAQIVLEPGHSEGVRVDLRPQTERGGSSLFIYSPVNARLFSRTTALLDQLGLTITEARIMTSKRNYAIDTYVLLDASGEPIVDPYQGEELLTLMREEMASTDTSSLPVSRPTPRRVRHFKVETRVNFMRDRNDRCTIVELFTTDYPGLLSRVGRIFDASGTVLESAKVATFGSQAEDVFYVTNSSGTPLTEDDQTRLRDKLVEGLDQAS